MQIAVLVAQLVGGLVQVILKAIEDNDQETLDKVYDVLPDDLRTTLAKAVALAKAESKLGARP